MERSIPGNLIDLPVKRDHRRSPRIRKVRPVAFSAGESDNPARCTVSANVSRGGMLLVTRNDRFPPAGTAIRLEPYGENRPGPAIPGRIVYTRFSPRAALRFAGLKFETDLNDAAAACIGLGDGEDPVGAALKKLEELEAMAKAPAALVETKSAPTHTRVRDRTQDKRYSVRDALGLDQLHLRLDAAAEEFVAAIARYLSEWGDAYLRDTVADKHALARAKGIEGIRALKREWRALQADLPALADAQLNRDHVWPSRERREILANGEANAFYDVERDQPTEALVEELRKLFGFIGRILVRHGFDDLGEDSDWAPLAHEDALVSYRGRVVLPDTLRTILCRAARDFEHYRALRGQTEEARERDARDEALRLWEQA